MDDYFRGRGILASDLDDTLQQHSDEDVRDKGYDSAGGISDIACEDAQLYPGEWAYVVEEEEQPDSHGHNALAIQPGLHHGRVEDVDTGESDADGRLGGGAEAATQTNAFSATDASTSNATCATRRDGIRPPSTAATACSRLSFESLEGVAAGASIREVTRDRPAVKPLAQWQSRFDKTFAEWVKQVGVSGNAIDRLLKDPSSQPLLDSLSWKSSDQLNMLIEDTASEKMKKACEWRKLTMTISAEERRPGEKEFILRYRSIRRIVEFFLAHDTFECDIEYAPYRLMTADSTPRRIYSEMSSCDWWWERQKAINIPGVTVIPLIISTDKTLVTNHSGHVSAYPVYLSIGNLPSHIRNSNMRPGSFLLGMLPIYKKGNVISKRQHYHDCMSKIFEEVRNAVPGEGWDVDCSDGQVRRCFPVVAVMAIDYEEQALVTGISMLKHCSVCQIEPDRREDLSHRAPWRTHETQKSQLRQQRDHRTQHKRPRNASLEDDTSWKTIHDVECFAWDLGPYVNIHESMMSDILHQLLTGILDHAMDWAVSMLQASTIIKGTARYKSTFEQMERDRRGVGDTTPKKAVVAQMIDDRFSSMPVMRGLKHFPAYSSYSGWTGDDMKGVLAQMMPALAPLLTEIEEPQGIQFLKSLADFCILANYRVHDEDTLRYMDLALGGVDAFKECFRRYRATKLEKDKANHSTGNGVGGKASATNTKGHAGVVEEPRGNFNFPKFHALTHFVDMIKLFGNAPSLDTGVFEHKHVHIKGDYTNTNKRAGWEDQVMEHDTRNMSQLEQTDDGRLRASMADEDIVQHSIMSAQMPTTYVDVNEFFGWNKDDDLRRRGFKSSWIAWPSIELQLDPASLPAFRLSIATFVREQRKAYGFQRLGDSHEGTDPLRAERNLPFMDGLSLRFHSSIKCWKRTGKEPDNPEHREEDVIRCAQHWNGQKGNKRCDWAWIHDSDDAQGAWGGFLPGQIMYSITIRESTDFMDTLISNSRSHDVGIGAMPTYGGAIFHVYKPLTPDAVVDPTHGMTEIMPMGIGLHRGELNGIRMYSVASVAHSIHVCPVNERVAGSGKMYINNTVDFESFNLFFNEDFEQQQAISIVKAKAAARNAGVG